MSHHRTSSRAGQARNRKRPNFVRCPSTVACGLTTAPLEAVSSPLRSQAGPASIQASDNFSGNNQRASVLDLSTRALSLVPNSLNEEEHSVGAILATDRAVCVMDRETWEPIDEVLRIDGAELPEQIPMLANHARWSLDDQLGCIRNITRGEGELSCRLFFTKGDAAADKAWNKVRQGHLRDISAGYQVASYTDIPASQTATVKGRQYTAGARRLRISTAWRPREGSLTPIGADEAAKIRQQAAGSLQTNVPSAPAGGSISSTAPALPRSPADSSTVHPFSQGGFVVNPELRRYLESQGLAAGSDDAAAQAFQRTLAGDARARADALATRSEPQPAAPAPAAAAQPAVPAAAPVATGERSAVHGSQPAAANGQPSTEQIRIAERDRIRELRRLAGEDVPAELLTRAIDEGWDTGRAGVSFLEAVRSGRAPSVGGDRGGPAIHSHGRDQDCTRGALEAAMLIRAGMDPVRDYQVIDQNGYFRPQRAEQRQQQMPQRSQFAELGYQFRRMSLVDMVREACRIDGIDLAGCYTTGEVVGQAFRNLRNWEMQGRAISSSALGAIFTQNFSAQYLAGYLDSPDTTVGWCMEEDVPNFLDHEIATMGKMGQLKPHTPGKQADAMDTYDWNEVYRVKRYTGLFKVDEMDMENDRFGALTQEAPRDMGMSARQIRPNLVYATILQNPALNADSVAVFDAEHHNNLSTDALSAVALQAALSRMSKQRIRGRLIDVRGRFLVVPTDLQWLADILVKSVQRINAVATSADTGGGTYNPLQNAGLEPVRVDDRIGAAGCIDPITGNVVPGSDTNWLLTARPGESLAKTVMVGFLRGTGRAPRLRAFILDKGNWGIGWDISYDIGCKAVDYRAMQFSSGAGDD